MNWLRLSFWVAAIADFIIAIMVLIPDRPGVDTYVISMGQMSAVAFSWGVMLILAAIKPMERRWIAVPTLLVVFLLAMVSVHALVTGLLPPNMIFPALGASVLVFTLLLIGYLKTRNTSFA
jgi:hypothetical protein